MIEVFENVACHNLEEPDGEEYLATCYGVKCDGCGKVHEHTDYGCDKMTNECDIEDDAICYGGFTKVYEGKIEMHFCDNCIRFIDFIDDEGLCPAEDEIYAEADIPLDVTHAVRYTICDGEIIGTRIVLRDK